MEPERKARNVDKSPRVPAHIVDFLKFLSRSRRSWYLILCLKLLVLT